MGEAHSSVVGGEPPTSSPVKRSRTFGEGSIVADIDNLKDRIDRAIEIKEHDVRVEGKASASENHLKVGLLRSAKILVSRAGVLLSDYGVDLDDDIDGIDDVELDSADTHAPHVARDPGVYVCCKDLEIDEKRTIEEGSVWEVHWDEEDEEYELALLFEEPEDVYLGPADFERDDYFKFVGFDEAGLDEDLTDPRRRWLKQNTAWRVMRVIRGEVVAARVLDSGGLSAQDFAVMPIGQFLMQYDEARVKEDADATDA